MFVERYRVVFTVYYEFMNGLDRMLKACEIMGIDGIRTLFIAGEINTDYLVFTGEVEREDFEKHEKELFNLGVVYLGKFGALAIERDVLWDCRNS